MKLRTKQTVEHPIIPNLRKVLGMGRKEFAEALGISRQKVYNWEIGVNIPKIEDLYRIWYRFGIDINEILLDYDWLVYGEIWHSKFGTEPFADLSESVIDWLKTGEGEVPYVQLKTYFDSFGIKQGDVWEEDKLRLFYMKWRRHYE